DEWWAFLPVGAADAIRADLGLRYREAGLMLTLILVGALLGQACTVAADHVDRRRLTTVGALGYAAALAAFAAARSFTTAAGAALVLGVSSAAVVHGGEVALVDAVGTAGLVRTIARVNLFGSIGTLLGPLTLAAAA